MTNSLDMCTLFVTLVVTFVDQLTILTHSCGCGVTDLEFDHFKPIYSFKSNGCGYLSILCVRRYYHQRLFFYNVPVVHFYIIDDEI